MGARSWTLLSNLIIPGCFYSPMGQPGDASGAEETGVTSAVSTDNVPTTSMTSTDESDSTATSSPVCEEDPLPLDPAVYQFEARNSLYESVEGLLEMLGIDAHHVNTFPTASQAGRPLVLVEANTGRFTYQPFTDIQTCPADGPLDGAFFGCDGFRYTTVDEQGCTSDGQAVLAVRPEETASYVRLASLSCRGAGFAIEGTKEDTAYAGTAVRSIGDLNGDGFDDILVGTCKNNASFIIYGKPDTSNIDLQQIFDAMDTTVSGRRIVGQDSSVACQFEYAGHLGDFNGDGLDDFILGAPTHGNGKGRVYLVFGASDLPQPLVLANLGAGGLTLDGEAESDVFGSAVAPAGDVNGDGLQDALITARFASGDGKDVAGKAYVVFGTDDSPQDPVPIETLVQTKQALMYLGEASSDWFGYSAIGGVDVNGDGLSDIISSAIRVGGDAGRIYVIFGQSEGPTPPLANVVAGDGGFAFDGGQPGWGSGFHLHAFEGAATSWLLVGSTGYDGDRGIAHALPLAAYVEDMLVTSPATLDLMLSGPLGFSLQGKEASDSVGGRVSGGGDFDGDGRPDILIAASEAIANDADNTGQVYAIFSQDFSTPIDLSVSPGRIPASRGFAFAGDLVGDFAGSSVDARGDINGDGMTDILVGARNAGTAEDEHEGRIYVAFGGCLSGARTTHLGRPPCADLNDCPVEVLMAGDGFDGIVGGARDNDIRNVGAQDVVNAGAGDDTIYVTAAGFVRITGGRGDDTLVVDGATLDLTTRHLPSIEAIENIELIHGATVTIDHRHVRFLAASARTRTVTVRGGPDSKVNLRLFGVKLPQFVAMGDNGAGYFEYWLPAGVLPLKLLVQTELDICEAIDMDGCE